MTGFIYKITNNVNGKVYIGLTRYSVESRWRQHIKKSHFLQPLQPLHKAFVKYGLDNFTVELIEEVDINKLDEREIFWIAKYNSFESGYNATLGGGGSKIYYWTDSNYEEIKNLYLSGFTIKKISNLYNCSNTTITEILKQLKVKIRRNPLDMNALERQEFILDYTNGVSLKELASRYNTDRETVKRFLVKHGVKLNIRSLILKDEKMLQEMLQDFLNNMHWKDIEIKYHSDLRTIKTILTKHHIDFKRGRSNGARNFDKTFEQLIIEKYNSGMKLEDISKYFNINITSIYNVLKRNNINCKSYNQSTSVQPLKSLEQG